MPHPAIAAEPATLQKGQQLTNGYALRVADSDAAEIEMCIDDCTA